MGRFVFILVLRLRGRLPVFFHTDLCSYSNDIYFCNGSILIKLINLMIKLSLQSRIIVYRLSSFFCKPEQTPGPSPCISG